MDTDDSLCNRTAYGNYINQLWMFWEMVFCYATFWDETFWEHILRFFLKDLTNIFLINNWPFHINLAPFYYWLKELMCYEILLQGISNSWGPCFVHSALLQTVPYLMDHRSIILISAISIKIVIGCSRMRVFDSLNAFESRNLLF